MGQAVAYTLVAFLGGLLMAVQAPTNALLARASGSPVMAALISFLVGTFALLAILLASGALRFEGSVRAVPWYAWLGGLYGAFFVAAAALVTPRIGVGALLTAAVGGQLVAAMLLDHYGLLGMEPRPATASRVLGLGLVFLGVLLVRRG